MDRPGVDSHRIRLPHQGTDPFFIPEDIGEIREFASYVVVGDAQVIPISMPSGEDVEVSPPPIDLSFLPSIPHAQQDEFPCPCLPMGAMLQSTVIFHVRHLLSKVLAADGSKVIAVISVVTVVVSFAATKPLVAIFARPDNPVYGLAVTGNRICTLALFFIGFNIFASGMFTALSNGIVSAILAFSRSFVFMLVTMLVLPALLGVNSIWLATPAAELMALALSVFLFLKYRKRYRY